MPVHAAHRRFGISSIVIATCPRRPEAHAIAWLDDDTPVFTVFFWWLGDKPKDNAETLHLERCYLDSTIFDLAERRQQLVAPRDASLMVHFRARAKIVDGRRQQAPVFVEQIECNELP